MTFPLKLYPISRIRRNPELLLSTCSESELYPLSLQKDLFICGLFFSFSPLTFQMERKRKYLPWTLTAQLSKGQFLAGLPSFSSVFMVDSETVEHACHRVANPSCDQVGLYIEFSLHI